MRAVIKNMTLPNSGLIELKFKVIKCIYRRKIAQIYRLRVVKLLFHYMNYPPDIQTCRKLQ